ncbi:alanine racemase [Pseudonocardia thermophila]|uniref:alanine racemase n=1 Tax=Pseudonocardia thermophila TaxID=1848 RepID=UPI000936AF64|nr:alanine racemase [Pseudonocardia thermophila]
MVITPDPYDTPSLLVDAAVLERNLSRMAAHAHSNGKRLVPHAKTHRNVALGLRQIAAGADGLTVAKLGEAEEFARAGVNRLVVAYPLVGEHKARRAVELSRRVELIVAADSVEGARSLAEVATAQGTELAVRLMIDSGLGREGLRPEEAVRVAREIAGFDGLHLQGIQTHEGNVYTATDEADLRARCREVARLMTSVAEELRAAGIPVHDVSVGASASARIMAEQSGITELRPGIYAFNDLGQVALGNAALADCAARVATTVVSSPRPGYGCIDAGSKALGADLVPAVAHRDAFPGYGLIPELPGWIVARLSEEHGWLRWTGAEPAPQLKIGERVHVIPNHVCMVFAALGECHLVEADTTTWLPCMSAGTSR